MSSPVQVPSFSVVPGLQVDEVCRGREKEIVDLVAATYRLHGAGDSVNPPSYFLRFPDRPNARIIALPASLGGEVRTDGLKWISSFPDNIKAGIPRASAVLILNDHDTGYPMACMESSIISAVRTAASAALAAAVLGRDRPRPVRVGFLGVGLIARYLHTYLAATGQDFERVGIYDLSAESAQGFRSYVEQAAPHSEIVVHDDPGTLLRDSDLIVLATVAGSPHLSDPAAFAHHPLVLHVSLRDIDPAIILESVNVVDDVEHCLKADTSVHLAEQRTGNRDFITGTLDDVISRGLELPGDQTIIFSPFGLGVLDLAVARFVYDTLAEADRLATVDNFFHELRRFG
ncbi:2,3-diaminopropionate biosynthesis protein SbnB [Actinoplanes sp. NPDC051346]|uniref:2,3-diaminopropionate biosynthesis protein SbnB n=1 Tax=Actinoplanes sp. NPDC051346 TaxID=3155048 RepID=UPI003437F408